MKRGYDELLKQALAPKDEPGFWLNQKILREAREEKKMKTKLYKKIPAVVLSAMLILGVGSLTTFAAWKYLMPSQVAEVARNEKLAEAFLSEEAVLVNETQMHEEYCITFLGIVSGEELTDYITIEDGSIRSDLSYIVVAFENADGTSMPDISEDAYGELEFLVTPFIRGYNPVTYNAFAFGGGYTDTVINGVLYRIMECDNMEKFADHDLYLGVLDSTFYRKDAYYYDEASGEISRNESYEGLNALFQLPLDESKADPEAAKIYMETLFSEGENRLESNSTGELEEWMQKLTPENIEEMAICVEHTVQVLMVDEKGYLNISPYEIDGRGGSGESSILESWAFGELESGMDEKFGFIHSGTLDTLRIETFTKNEDGTYTFAVYIPK